MRVTTYKEFLTTLIIFAACVLSTFLWVFIGVLLFYLFTSFGPADPTYDSLSLFARTFHRLALFFFFAPQTAFPYSFLGYSAQDLWLDSSKLEIVLGVAQWVILALPFVVFFRKLKISQQVWLALVYVCTVLLLTPAVAGFFSLALFYEGP